MIERRVENKRIKEETLRQSHRFTKQISFIELNKRSVQGCPLLMNIQLEGISIWLTHSKIMRPTSWWPTRKQEREGERGRKQDGVLVHVKRAELSPNWKFSVQIIHSKFLANDGSGLFKITQSFAESSRSFLTLPVNWKHTINEYATKAGVYQLPEESSGYCLRTRKKSSLSLTSIGLVLYRCIFVKLTVGYLFLQNHYYLKKLMTIWLWN